LTVKTIRITDGSVPKGKTACSGLSFWSKRPLSMLIVYDRSEQIMYNFLQGISLGLAVPSLIEATGRLQQYIPRVQIIFLLYGDTSPAY